ncbi:hypothetical protein M6B38_106365 [Iris pallida]|uniref:Uncharacterized protein n=1 Tax=Iris pallida TaxID=29817 RepID=A0AAX6ES89_IRIPA|nr:hypothetical protein M6B38_106365 [Iris pallida]
MHPLVPLNSHLLNILENPIVYYIPVTLSDSKSRIIIPLNFFLKEILPHDPLPRAPSAQKGNRSANFRNDHVLITSESFSLPPKTTPPPA